MLTGFVSLNGLGAGPAETAQPTIIADVIFLHDRGKYNTLYFAFYFGSLMVSPSIPVPLCFMKSSPNQKQVGPIIAGPMAARYGPVSFWWLNTALLGLVCIACIFFFPETRYERPFQAQNSTIASSSPLKSGSNEKVEGEDLNQHEITTQDHANPGNSAVLQSSSKVEDEKLEHAHTHEDPWLGRGTPSKQQWKLVQPYKGNLFMEFLLPWKLLAFPIVEFSAFVVSWSASSFLTLNLTQTQAFAAPPYNFSSQTIGFFNFAILVGGFIGLFTAGPLSDWISAVLTRRNKGIREPEMRLLTMIPYVIIMILGNVIVAVGYQQHWNWKVRPFLSGEGPGPCLIFPK